MPSNTTNLNLYKVDPMTDGNLTFNIKTMLNDNWDKIDAAVIAKALEANGYTDSKIAQLINAAPGALDTLKALADALNDDANFANTITNLITSKVNDLAGAGRTSETVKGVSDALNAHLAEAVKIILSDVEPTEADSNMYWLVDLGDAIDFNFASSGISIANATAGVSEPNTNFWFQET